MKLNYSIIYDLIKISYNVYYDIDSSNWLNITLPNVTDISVSKDGIRSYLFTNQLKKDVVIAFKGTTAYWVTNNVLLDNKMSNNMISQEDICGLSSSSNDKYNDNLFFSCCYYKQSGLFEKCNTCETKNGNENTCCKTCYKNSLNDTRNYINELQQIIEKSKEIIDFDNTNLYFTGHSLGGMLASISSMLYDKPAVSFETPGDYHYLKMVYNITNLSKIYHFGHNSDPLFIGNCGNLCSFLGYHVNTKCHSGYTCLYDSKNKLGLGESLLNHRIEYVTKHIVPNWENDMPECVQDENCKECEDWVNV
jgi:lipase ATG15